MNAIQFGCWWTIYMGSSIELESSTRVNIDGIWPASWHYNTQSTKWTNNLPCIPVIWNSNNPFPKFIRWKVCFSVKRVTPQVICPDCVCLGHRMICQAQKYLSPLRIVYCFSLHCLMPRVQYQHFLNVSLECGFFDTVPQIRTTFIECIYGAQQLFACGMRETMRSIKYKKNTHSTCAFSLLFPQLYLYGVCVQ